MYLENVNSEAMRQYGGTQIVNLVQNDTEFIFQAIDRV